jgi:DNA-binding transcriptional regulator YiaG
MGERETRRRGRRPVWTAARIRALRRHLGLSQQALADELGTRQQTISEWETGLYQPRGLSERFLTMIAERAGFAYGADEADEAGQPAPGEPEGS